MSIGPLTLVRDFLPWRALYDKSAIETGSPWITFGAQRFLDRAVSIKSRVFEYGTGGSTRFFARRVQQVVSVEHDPAWFDKVRYVVIPYHNVDMILCEPTEPAEERYGSSDPAYAGKSFRDYVHAIDQFPDGRFDVVVVDGRSRVDAFIHAMPKVKPGGYIVLDDSERATYAEALEAARPWHRQDFAGPKPFVVQFSRTTIWRRPAADVVDDAGPIAPVAVGGPPRSAQHQLPDPWETRGVGGPKPS